MDGRVGGGLESGSGEDRREPKAAGSNNRRRKDSLVKAATLQHTYNKQVAKCSTCSQKIKSPKHVPRSTTRGVKDTPIRRQNKK